jgi:hypothetical protein
MTAPAPDDDRDGPSTAAVLRRSVQPGAGAARVVTLDPRFQGLPDTAHGGSVLALFDAVARGDDPRVDDVGADSGGRARTVAGIYRRRVPLATPLALAIDRDGTVVRLRLSDGAAVLVDGVVTTGAEPQAVNAGVDPHAPPSDETALPISKTCFACGVENTLGLGVRLGMDDEHVFGVWVAPARFRGPDGALATVALTTLLDEAAFWLGAAASGEAGMTTDIRVRLHADTSGSRLVVAGPRAAVRASRDDPRYWETTAAAWDERGTLVASAAITFVAVRGSARKLVTGLLAMNPPAVLRRVFPSYVS